MAKRKVFVSYDCDNDRTLKEFIVGQADHADSTFEVIDFSRKEANQPSTWLEEARAAIERAEVFVVILGPKTRTAPNVLEEIAIANELAKEKLQLIGYAGGNEAWAVPGAGRVYQWHWEALKQLLA